MFIYDNLVIDINHCHLFNALPLNNLKDQFNCQTKSELIDRVFELGYANVLPSSLIVQF